MSNIPKILGVPANEVKNFEKFLQKNKIDEPKEYLIVFDPNNEGKFTDGSAVNIVSGQDKITIYNIAPNDNLNKIAKKFGLTVNELVKANNIKNPDKIKDTEFLKLPLKNDSDSIFHQDDPDAVNYYRSLE